MDGKSNNKKEWNKVICVFFITDNSLNLAVYEGYIHIYVYLMNKHYKHTSYIN